ncbi:AraC family transcriptional regulator [Shewanella nanhaiensis]|uniref:Helix-turn-helix domain-containing protein n=1 Tax=Shewanella nanhaiensis TaxID=2864872 RepID=A0ABS7E341_9GAMM|nr:helix-turn-helix domain-containing protein [Shewanella nanhaiensis]MBW8184101.1 helix-turn-helix domain-containing protein [Shewanella nanhaiensis]
MSQIQIVILAIGGIQGFLLFTLLFSDKRVNYASKLLGIQCLFIATTFVLPLIVEAENSLFTWLIGFLVFLPACYGGLTYLYCRTAITGLPLKRIDILHFLPLAICYLINYDILFPAEKALEFVRLPDNALLIKMITKMIIFGQIIIYTALSIKMVHFYQIKAKQTLSSYNPDIFKWLWCLIIFIVSFWALSIFFNFISRIHSINTLSYILLVLMVYFIAFVQLRNPSLFHVKQLKQELAQSSSTDINQSSDGLLDQEMRSNLLSLIQKQVKEQALYRNSELTLSNLANQVGVSVHHLSETLNQQGGKNFNLFINEYRVADVCQQLEQKSDRNLIDLALEAGFSSKSSFNATFKKLTGKTPSVYRQQIT